LEQPHKEIYSGEGRGDRERERGGQVGRHLMGEIERHINKETERLRNDKKIPSKLV
jgi:hypothetical protein